MCLDPVSMAVISLVSTGIGAMSQYSSQMAQASYQRQLAERQAQAYQQQAEIANSNAAIENNKAEIAQDKGASDIAATKRKALQLSASQRATMGALGFTTTDGSPEKILDDTEFNLNLDMEALRFNNKMTKWGYDVNRVNFLNEALSDKSSADMARWQGETTASQLEFGAKTTLLTTMLGAGVDAVGKFGGSTSTKSKIPSNNGKVFSIPGGTGNRRG